MLSFEIPELHSAISLFAKNGLSGAFPHRDDYHREHLPTEYTVLHVWTHMHFYCSPPNEFYPPEVRQLRCKSTNKDGRVLFDPILVKVTTGRGRTGKLYSVHCCPKLKCYCDIEERVADLRLIFRAAKGLDNETLAYVHWYGPTKRPHRAHRLHEVSKMMRGDQRAGGVIKLCDILGPCPLASKLDASSPPGVDQNKAYHMLSSFYINPFASHLDYELFR